MDFLKFITIGEYVFKGIPFMVLRYGIYNCLMEAVLQEGSNRCSCYPGYLIPSNHTCQGESLSCFKNVINELGDYLLLSEYNN